MNSNWITTDFDVITVFMAVNENNFTEFTTVKFSIYGSKISKNRERG